MSFRPSSSGWGRQLGQANVWHHFPIVCLLIHTPVLSPITSLIQLPIHAIQLAIYSVPMPTYFWEVSFLRETKPLASIPSRSS